LIIIIAKWRAIGFLPLDGGLIVMAGAAFYGAFTAGGGVDGIVKLLTA
jgi:hypothetical protein